MKKKALRVTPEALIARSNSASKVCFCFFPVNKIDAPLNKSTEMSKSPHLVKRFETKDPNGWTVAPNNPKQENGLVSNRLNHLITVLEKCEGVRCNHTFTS